MHDLESKWRELADVAGQIGTPFVPLSDVEIDAWRALCLVPDWFASLLRIGYPTKSLRVFATTWFPSLDEVRGLATPLPLFPLEFSDGHILDGVTDAHDSLGRFVLEDSDAAIEPCPRWSSLRQVLELLSAVIPNLQRFVVVGPRGIALLTRPGVREFANVAAPGTLDEVLSSLGAVTLESALEHARREVTKTGQLLKITGSLAVLGGLYAAIDANRGLRGVALLVAVIAGPIFLLVLFASRAERAELRALEALDQQTRDRRRS